MCRKDNRGAEWRGDKLQNISDVNIWVDHWLHKCQTLQIIAYVMIIMLDTLTIPEKVLLTYSKIWRGYFKMSYNLEWLVKVYKKESKSKDNLRFNQKFPQEFTGQFYIQRIS